eukprot:12512366-Alexandrium_andersonii.AAC.1
MVLMFIAFASVAQALALALALAVVLVAVAVALVAVAAPALRSVERCALEVGRTSESRASRRYSRTQCSSGGA